MAFITGGFHKQVAVMLGEVPVVDLPRHPAILLPFQKKSTLPATDAVTVMVTATPFTGEAESDGVPTLAYSATFTTVKNKLYVPDPEFPFASAIVKLT